MSATTPLSYSPGNKDLESFGVLETFLHTGSLRTYFARNTQRATPFAKMDAEITRAAPGAAQFGQVFESPLNPPGDYLIHVYLEVELGAVELSDENRFGASGALGYVANLGHHLFRKAALVINGIEVASLDGKFLDAELEYMVDGAKYAGYKSMVGNGARLNPSGVARGRALPATSLLLPLPFFFSKDSGTALPVAAMGASEILLRLETRKWEELLVLEDSAKVSCSVTAPSAEDLKALPEITSLVVKCDYALATQKERTALGCAERYMLIEQPATHPLTELALDAATGTATVTFDAPLGAIKSLYFGAVNMTHGNLAGHYLVGCPATSGPSRVPEGHGGAALAQVGLRFDEDERVPAADARFFSKLHPHYYANRVPEAETGLYFYSFALKPRDIDPTGTTNPGAGGKKLHFDVKASPAMLAAVADEYHPQRFGFSLTTVSYRLARIGAGRFELLHSDGKFRAGDE